MSDSIGHGILELIARHEPGVARAEPEAVVRVVQDLATSLAGVLAGVVLNHGEPAAKLVADKFSELTESGVISICGKVVKVMRDQGEVH